MRARILTLHSTRSSSDPDLASAPRAEKWPGLGLAGSDSFRRARRFLIRDNVFSIPSTPRPRTAHCANHSQVFTLGDGIFSPNSLWSCQIRGPALAPHTRMLELEVTNLEDQRTVKKSLVAHMSRHPPKLPSGRYILSVFTDGTNPTHSKTIKCNYWSWQS